MKRLIWVALACLLVAPQDTAQAGSPPRNGNVWNGVAHEPSPVVVLRKERAVGILPSTRDQARQDDDVERLAQELLQYERHDRMD